MSDPIALPRLLVFSDVEACARAGLSVDDALKALLRSDLGKSVAVVVRDKAASPAALRNLCLPLRALRHEQGPRLFLHGHEALARQLGLDGVHLDSRTRVEEAGSDTFVVGASRHEADPLDDFALDGLNAITLSPVFRPLSKPDDTREPLGLAGFHRLQQTAARPVFALGGVDAKSAAACLDHGAHGVAVIDAVMGQPDPVAAAFTLRSAVLSRLERRGA